MINKLKIYSDVSIRYCWFEENTACTLNWHHTQKDTNKYVLQLKFEAPIERKNGFNLFGFTTDEYVSWNKYVQNIKYQALDKL